MGEVQRLGRYCRGIRIFYFESRLMEKLFYIVLLSSITHLADAESKKEVPLADSFIILTDKCHYNFDDSIKPYLKSATLDTDNKNFYSLNFSVRIKTKNIIVDGKTNLGCQNKNNSTSESFMLKTPQEIIEYSNTNGRYSEHIAWQKPIAGINWSGQIAYVDYVNGDGQSTKVNNYLACFSLEKSQQNCIKFEGCANEKNHSKIKQKIVFDFVRKIINTYEVIN